MNEPVAEAARVALRGGLVVYPTDTLYGLGASLRNETAVRRVFAAKGRPLDEPLTIAVASVGEIDRYAVATPLARRLFGFLPGPLTLVLERRPAVPDVVTGGETSVGVRVPAHPTGLALLRAAGPLTATSANLHGRPDPSTVEEAQAQLGERADFYLTSPTPLLGAASTLIDARGPVPRILRRGALSDERIREHLRE